VIGIRANPNLGSTGFAGGINLAVLRYAGALPIDPISDPSATQPAPTAPLNEANLVPLENPGAVGTPGDAGVDMAMNLAFNFDFSTLTLQINGKSFVPPTVPVLLQIMSGAQSAASLLPSGSVYTLPGNANIQLSLPAGVAGGPHPFHASVYAYKLKHRLTLSTAARSRLRRRPERRELNIQLC
jgi:iron transport multicopper oxidase